MSFLRIDATEWWGLRRRSSSVSWRFLGNNQWGRIYLLAAWTPVRSGTFIWPRTFLLNFLRPGVDRLVASCRCGPTAKESALAFELSTTLELLLQQ